MLRTENLNPEQGECVIKYKILKIFKYVLKCLNTTLRRPIAKYSPHYSRP